MALHAIEKHMRRTFGPQVKWLESQIIEVDAKLFGSPTPKEKRVLQRVRRQLKSMLKIADGYANFRLR